MRFHNHSDEQNGQNGFEKWRLYRSAESSKILNSKKTSIVIKKDVIVTSEDKTNKINSLMKESIWLAI